MKEDINKNKSHTLLMHIFSYLYIDANYLKINLFNVNIIKKFYKNFTHTNNSTIAICMIIVILIINTFMLFFVSMEPLVSEPYC